MSSWAFTCTVLSTSSPTCMAARDCSSRTAAVYTCCNSLSQHHPPSYRLGFPFLEPTRPVRLWRTTSKIAQPLADNSGGCTVSVHMYQLCSPSSPQSAPNLKILCSHMWEFCPISWWLVTYLFLHSYTYTHRWACTSRHPPVPCYVYRRWPSPRSSAPSGERTSSCAAR